MTGAASLLNDKLVGARLPEVCAPRQALLEGLQRRAAHKRLLFFSAPAGCGKSVAAQLWLRHTGRQPVWLALDPYDNAPAIFYRLLCAGLLAVQPGNARMAEYYADPLFSASPVEHTVGLLSELLPEETPRVLVLDDLHCITHPELVKSLPMVLRRLPHTFQTLLLSRGELPQPVREALQDDWLWEIGPSELALTPLEVKKLFGAHGHFITREEAERVRDATNGWAIGILAMAMGGLTEPDPQSREFDEYIRRHIWRTWTPDQKEFMLKTAVADRMDQQLCRILTGRRDSGEMLRELCMTNAFLSAAEDGVYRYHHLFLDFLRRQWEPAGIAVEELHRLAAGCYCDRGEYQTARRHAIQSRDVQAIVGVSQRFVQHSNPSLDEYVGFWSVFGRDVVPEAVCDEYPFLYSPLVWHSYLCGDRERMIRYLDRLYPLVPLIAERYPQLLENILLLLHLDPRRSFRCQIEHFGSLPQPPARQTRIQAASLTMQMPFLHRSNRDYSELTDPALMERLNGTFGLMLKEYYPTVMRYVRAGLLLEQNRQAEAAEQIAGDSPEALTRLPPELACAAFAHHAAVALAAGNHSQLALWVGCMEEVIEREGARYLRPNFCALRVRLRLLEGDAAAARGWLEQYFVSEAQQPELYRIYQHFTTVRAYMALELWDKALALARGLKRLAEDFGRLLDRAEAGALEAVLLWAAGRDSEALATLEEVLLTLQERRFIAVVAGAGAAVLPPLKKLAAQLRRSEAPGQLDSAYLQEVILAAARWAKRYRGCGCRLPQRPVKLSGRQREMLQLLARGCKNSEIAEETGLSIHTVKAHLAVVYDKLEVNRSAEAVNRGKELGLIR